MSLANIVGAIALLLFVPAVQAAGGNYGFLAKSPYAFMKDEDRAQFQAALAAALKGAADGETREWSNSSTRSGGKVTVLRTLDSDTAGHCREVRIANRAGGRSETNDMVLCQRQDGRWLPREGP